MPLLRSQRMLILLPTTLSIIKELGESLKPSVEIIAIIIAGIWSYKLFLKNRVDYPYPTVRHDITHWCLPNNKLYLSVIVTVTNAGNVLLPLESGKVLVQQIHPLLSELQTLIDDAEQDALGEGKIPGLFHENTTQIAWRELGYREFQWDKGEITIEPGESEEFQYDFILENTVRTIKVITYYKNIKRKKSEAGWKLTSIYDVSGGNNE